MSNILKNSWTWAATVIGAVFTVLPESVFGKCFWTKEVAKKIVVLWPSCPLIEEELNSLVGRIILAMIVFAVSVVLYGIYIVVIKNSVYIKGKNYYVQVKYGNIFRQKGWKVIPFDECFSTKIGVATADIKASSVCGQYLEQYPIDNMRQLIVNSKIKPSERNSFYQGKTRYESGVMIPRADYFLLSFAKLDKDGKGYFASREEYLQCLARVWEELDAKYGYKDVCLPVLGAGITRIGDVNPTRQELVDMMIFSYKLSRHKIKTKLKIICIRGKKDGFSLDKIGSSI